MDQHEFINQLKDAFLAGYYRDRSEAKLQDFLLTPEQKVKAEEVRTAAYDWALTRMRLRLFHAQL